LYLCEYSPTVVTTTAAVNTTAAISNKKFVIYIIIKDTRCTYLQMYII
jgi:hypothetical protein